jgi:hypothetical protein
MRPSEPLAAHGNLPSFDGKQGSKAQRHDRPVTPEVAGSSPVAPVLLKCLQIVASCCPFRRQILFRGPNRVARGEGPVDAGALLERIAEGAPVPVAIEAEPAALDPSTAQKLGIVANELITNAFQHGAPPIVVQLKGGRETRLQVDDRGTGPAGNEPGLGLQLVRDMVEQGLRGRFELAALPEGGTRAAVFFPKQSR